MLDPRFDFVIMKREQFKAPSGILIPESAQQRIAPNKGTCVAVGPDCDEQIKVGKTYLWGAHAGSWLNEQGTPVTDETDEAYYVVQDTQILAEVT